MNRDDILTALKQVKYDLSVTQTRIGEIARDVAALPAPDTRTDRCAPCGLTFRGPQSLAEHAYVHHDGPVPAHYLEAERRAGFSQAEPPFNDTSDVIVALVEWGIGSRAHPFVATVPPTESEAR